MDVVSKFLTALGLLLLFNTNLIAQPSNDDCSGVINLGVVPICDNTIYSNLGATPSDIAFNNEPACFISNPPLNDVWFSFSTTAEADDLKILIESNGPNGIQNIQAAIYRGFCIANGLALLSCGSDGSSSLTLDVQDLLPGEQYFLRVDNSNGPVDQGSFTICIEEGLPSFMISDGSSTECEGLIFDSGGPEGNYSNNENYVFEICPNEPFQCLSLELEYYHLESGEDEVTDFLNIYAGDINTGNILGTIGGNQAFNFTETNGGVCYSISSNQCISLEFHSDNNLNFEGFSGNWFCTKEACESFTDIVLEDNFDINTIETLLSTDANTVKVLEIDCADEAVALFSKAQNNLGIETGILLTTGNALEVGGTNEFRSLSTFNNTPGDSDLDSLSVLQSGILVASADACSITIEVTANTDEINFEYIFGSEEYTEFVEQGFNDIFALLIDGPGIIGEPSLQNKKNLAVLKGSNIPVEIDGINNVKNWQYYRDNPPGQPMEYNGFISDSLGAKKSLTATTKVTPCDTYRLKFSIGDRGDPNFDSGVFISRIEGAKSSISFINDQQSNTLFENCSLSPSQLLLIIPEGVSSAIEYSFSIEGTATKDLDYIIDLPSSIVVNPPDSIYFPISVIADTLDEGDETVTIILTADYGCGPINLSESTLIIKDNFDINILPDQDRLDVCVDSSIDLSIEGNAFYVWSSDLFLSDSLQNNINVSPNASAWVSLSASTTGLSGELCEATDSIYLNAIVPSIEIEATGSPSFCRGDSVILFANTNGNPEDILWSPSIGGFSTLTGPITVVSPDFGDFELYYFAESTIAGCTVRDSILINVENIVIPSFLNTDTIICPGDSILLANTPFPWNTIYQWTPEDQLDNPNAPTPIGFPDSTQVYQVITTSGEGNCIDTSSVTIYVPTVEISVNETEFIADEIYSFDFITNPMLDYTAVNWYLNDSLSSNNSPFETSFDESENVLILELFLDDHPCPLYDTLFIDLTESIVNIDVPNLIIPTSDIEENRIFRYIIHRNGEIFFDELDYELLNFKIFNRWGNLVYECNTKECGEAGWDGMINGQAALSDTYLYLIELRLENQEAVQLRGDVQLLR